MKIGRPALGATSPEAIKVKIMTLEELGLSDNPTIIANTMYAAAQKLDYGNAVVRDFTNNRCGDQVRNRLYELTIENNVVAKFTIMSRNHSSRIIIYRKR